MDHLIGLLINPMAGRDIRRVVAAASLQSSPEKLLTIRRILAGVAAMPGIRVAMLSDREGFAEYVASELSRDISIEVIDGPDDDGGALTTRGVRTLQEAGAEAIIVIGGDGTQRNAAEAFPAIPLLPIAGGTNNVACWGGDQTAAGYAAALYVTRHLDPLEAGWRSKVIHVRIGAREHLALIDVGLVRQPFTGALAVWREEDVEAVVLAVADPTRPGLSNVGGFVHPVGVEDDLGLSLDFTQTGSGTSVPAVLVPGLMVTLGLARARPLALDEEVQWSRSHSRTLALDGERTVVLRAGDVAHITIRRDGPFVLDPRKILRMEAIRYPVRV